MILFQVLFPTIIIPFSHYQNSRHRNVPFALLGIILLVLISLIPSNIDDLTLEPSQSAFSPNETMKNYANTTINFSTSSASQIAIPFDTSAINFPGFIENRAQHPDPELLYYFMQDTYAIAFYESEVQVYTRLEKKDPWEYLSITFPGSLPSIPRGIGQLPTTTNYFNLHPAITGIRHYAEIHYELLYLGITMRFYCTGNSLKYDFIIAPLVDPSIIQLELNAPIPFDTEITPERVVCTSRTTSSLILWEEHSLFVYQDHNSTISTVFCQRETIPIRYGFTTENYDPMQALVIDPLLITFSTFLGGDFWDEGEKIAVDDSGYVYISGISFYSRFPIGYNMSFVGGTQDIFVAKVSPDTQTLIEGTVLGGSEYDYNEGLAVDELGFVYLTGYTQSSNFPIMNAFDATFNGGNTDGFLTIFSPDSMSLLYSTYLGGSGEDLGLGIAIDNAGDVYITGQTTSSNFPTMNAYDAILNGYLDVFITKFSSHGQSLLYSTFFGGSGTDESGGLAVDELGCLYITGVTSSSDFPLINAYCTTHYGTENTYVAKFSSDGQSLLYSTYFGDSGRSYSKGIALDDMGSVYLAGITLFDSLPTINAYDGTFNGGVDTFVAKFTSDGQSLLYCTYVGGSGDDWVKGMAIDDLGSVYVIGYTNSSDFPIVNTYDTTYNGGDYDVLVYKLNPDNQSLGFSTYLGGEGVDNGYGIAVDAMGNGYFVGSTTSFNFPLIKCIEHAPTGVINCFMVKIELDTDNDLLPDGWEYLMGLNATDPNDFILDKDNDGLFNRFEYQLGTNASNPDTDYDHLPDGWEYLMDFNAIDPQDATLDFDQDGLTNLLEYLLGTNPLLTDTDKDQLPDRWEYDMGLNATDPQDAGLDFDRDGLSNLEEFLSKTDLYDYDSDNDGFRDGIDLFPLSFLIPTGISLIIAFVLGIVVLGIIFVQHQHRLLFYQSPTSMLVQVEQRLVKYNYIAAKDVLQRYLQMYQIKVFRVPPPSFLYKLLQTVSAFSRYLTAVTQIPRIPELPFMNHDSIITTHLEQITTMIGISDIAPCIKQIQTHFDQLKDIRKDLLLLVHEFQEYQQIYTKLVSASPSKDPTLLTSPLSTLSTQLTTFSQKVHECVDSYLPQCELLRMVTTLHSEIEGSIQKFSQSPLNVSSVP